MSTARQRKAETAEKWSDHPGRLAGPTLAPIEVIDSAQAWRELRELAGQRQRDEGQLRNKPD